MKKNIVGYIVCIKAINRSNISKKAIIEHLRVQGVTDKKNVIDNDMTAPMDFNIELSFLNKSMDFISILPNEIMVKSKSIERTNLISQVLVDYFEPIKIKSIELTQDYHLKGKNLPEEVLNKYIFDSKKIHFNAIRVSNNEDIYSTIFCCSTNTIHIKTEYKSKDNGESSLIAQSFISSKLTDLNNFTIDVIDYEITHKL